MGQGTIQGLVIDKSNSPLIGAVVQLAGTTTATVTDYDGKYMLKTPAGEQKIVISYIGYSNLTQMVNVPQGGKVDINFTLVEDALALDELVVTGTFSGRSQKNSPISMTVLNNKQLTSLAFNSQADILRAVPGITAEGGGGEVAANIFVRGMPSGGQYQFTPLQVDGLPTISTFGLNSSAHDVYFRNDIGIRNLEFVRGGASTLFGAGSVAGIINYTSMTGSSEQKNKIGLEWAEKGRLKADFLTTGPLAENLYYAFSGFYRYDQGPLETDLETRGYQLRGNVKKVFNDGLSSLTLYGQAIDDKVQFYLPYPLANNDGNYERPKGNDGETIYTLLTGQATDFTFDTPFGRYESPIEQGVSTKGGYFMADLKHSFGNDWRLQSKVKTAKYDHWFNLFLDGDGVHNVPETQADYLTDRELPANATFTYADDGKALAANDLLFENRILDRSRPMEELVGEFNLTKVVDAGSMEHNLTIGTYHKRPKRLKCDMV
jgi:outer membrane receptor protein involved in Fe transport